MSSLTYNEALATQQAAGTLLTGYTTAKSVLNPQSLYTLPPNWWYIGRMLRCTVTGGISNRVTGPDTTTFQIMMGSIAVWTSGAVNLTTTAHTTIPFWLEVLLTCQVVGSGTAAKLMGQGRLTGIMFNIAASQADSAANHTTLLVPNTAPAQGTGFDSTVSNILDFWVAQSFSTASNGIQVAQTLFEALN